MGVVLDLKNLSFSTSEQDRESFALGKGRERKGLLLSEEFGESSGVPELRCGLPSSGKALPNPNNGVDELSHLSGVQGPPSPSGRRVEVCPSSLDKSRIPGETSPNAPGSPLCRLNDRCVGVRMGRCYDPLPGEGNLGSITDGVLNELEGTKGNPSDLDLLRQRFGRENGQGAVGQYNSHILSKAPGILSLPFSMEPHQRNSGIVPGEGHLSHSNSSERSSQCPGGRTIQEFTNFHRVEPGPSVLHLDMPAVGLARSGAIRDEIQQPTTSVHLPLPGPVSCGLGCLQPGLGKVPISIRLSPNPAASRCGQKAKHLSGFRVSDSSVLANSRLVSAAVSPVPEEVPAEARSLSPSEDSRRPPGVSSGIILKSSRLDTIADGLSRQGFNEGAVQLMLSEHKDSTVRQYQSTWSKFLGYLAKEGIAHERIVLSTVYNFLSAELVESDWAYATIAGYRCALVHPLLYALGLDLEGKHRVSFMTGLFSTKPPPSTTRFPIWSVSDVLFFLVKGPCDPLEEATWPLLTMKVFFLVMLVSRRRFSIVAIYPGSMSVGRINLFELAARF